MHEIQNLRFWRIARSGEFALVYIECALLWEAICLYGSVCVVFVFELSLFVFMQIILFDMHVLQIFNFQNALL